MTRKYGQKANDSWITLLDYSISDTNTEYTISVKTGFQLAIDRASISDGTIAGTLSVTGRESSTRWRNKISSGGADYQSYSYDEGASGTYTWNKTHSAQTVTVSHAATVSGSALWNGPTSSIISGSSTATQTFTIPAKTSYTVSYNANGGSGAPSAQTKWYGETLTLSATRPTRSGYAFKGWATSGTGSAVYQPGGSYTGNSAMTLYAVWSKLPAVTVTAHRVDADGADDPCGGYALVHAAWSSDTAITARTVNVGSLSKSLGAAAAGSGSISETLGDGTNIYPLTAYAVSFTVTNDAGPATATFTLAADSAYSLPVVEISDVFRSSGGTTADDLGDVLRAPAVLKVRDTPSNTLRGIRYTFAGIGPEDDELIISDVESEDGWLVKDAVFGSNHFEYSDIPPTQAVPGAFSVTVYDKFYSTTVKADLAPTPYTAVQLSDVTVYRSDYWGNGADEGMCAAVEFDWSMYVTGVNSKPHSLVVRAFDEDGNVVANKDLSLEPDWTGTGAAHVKTVLTASDIAEDGVMYYEPVPAGGELTAQGDEDGGPFSTDLQYTVNVYITDVYTVASKSDILTTAFFTIDVLRGGHGIAFGKPASREAMDVRFAAYFEKDVTSDAEVVATDADGTAHLLTEKTTTRVKGNAESSYRTGDVNITYPNIGTAPVANGGTGATTAANARANLGTLSANYANGYWGMGKPDGSYSGNDDWIRTTERGIIPSASGGSGQLGTSSWPFNSVYAKNMYMYSNGALYSKYTSYSAAANPSGSLWLDAVVGVDSANQGRLNLRQLAHADGYQGVQLEAHRIIGSTNHYNGVRMEIDGSGNRRVIVSDGAIWRSAIGCGNWAWRSTAVLYNNGTGTNGTVPLSASAANYNHMRIFFKKNGDSNSRDSVDVYSPNGNRASLIVANAATSSISQFIFASVTISGTSITRYNKTGYLNIGNSSSGLDESNLYIYRVEAWNE